MGMVVDARDRGAGGSGGYAPPPQSQTSQGARTQNDFLKQFQSVWDMGVIANAPNDTAINNNIKSYMEQLGLNQANQQMQTGYINQDNAFGQAKLGLSREGLGIQRDQLGRAKALSPQQHALAMEALTQREGEARFGAEKSGRALDSQATTQGATVSTGARQGVSDIATQLGFGLQDIGRSRAGEELSFKERQANLADQEKSLNLAAKGMDIDGQELGARTQRALDQLGLSTSTSVQDITRAINDLNAGRYNPLQALLGTIYQSSGVKPNATTGG